MLHKKSSDAQTLDKEKKSVDKIASQTLRMRSHLEKYGCIDGDVCRSIGAGRRCEGRAFDLRKVGLIIKTVSTRKVFLDGNKYGTYCLLKEGDGCSECDGKLGCEHGKLAVLSNGDVQFDAPVSCKIKKDFIFSNTFDCLAMVKKDFNLFDEPVSDVDGGFKK